MSENGSNLHVYHTPTLLLWWENDSHLRQLPYSSARYLSCWTVSGQRYFTVLCVWLRSPQRETSSMLVSQAVQEQVPVRLFSLQMKQKHWPAIIGIPVTAADKQPSLKKPLPHNEMWNIISRVGTRQFQNLPSDVFSLFLSSVFLYVFCFIHFPPPPPCACLSVCQTLF